MARVERVERVLEDHLQVGDRALVALLDRQVAELEIAEHDVAVGRRLKAHQHLGEGGLAAAGLADDRDRLRLARVEADLLVGLHRLRLAGEEERALLDLIMLGEVVDLEHDVAGRASPRAPFPRRAGASQSISSTRTQREAWKSRARHLDHRDRAGVAASGDEVVAARAEIAAGRALMRQRKLAGDGDERMAVLVGAGNRNGGEEAARIRMAHGVEDFGDRADLHRLAGIHHRDAVAGLEDQPEIVRDVDHRGAELRGDLLDELDDPRLHRHVERRGRLVEQKELRVRQQRHGDDDALLLAARNLVRIGAHDALGVGQADAARASSRARSIASALLDALVVDRHLGELLAAASSTGSARPSAPDRPWRSWSRGFAAAPPRSSSACRGPRTGSRRRRCGRSSPCTA